MALLHATDVEDYRPMYGALYVQDVRTPDWPGRPVGELLGEGVVRTAPGWLAQAGDGWLMGSANDNTHIVRLEVHDGPPPAGDLPDWDDVLETPFASSGVTCLTVVTNGPVGEPMTLGRPGLYRVRFARRPVFPGSGPSGVANRYRLQFWPVDGPPEPPQVLRRGDAVGGDRPGAARDPYNSDYLAAVADVVALVLWAAETATPLTLTWLAGRMLTTAVTVRSVLEHPAAGVLVVAGDLDDADAPLSVTIDDDAVFPNGRPRGGIPTTAAGLTRSASRTAPKSRGVPKARAVPATRTEPAHPPDEAPERDDDGPREVDGR